MARYVIKRHEVLTRLLRHFGLDEATIYADVEGMEHHISPQTLRAFTLLADELDDNARLSKDLKKKLRSGKA
jgi:Mn-dependent DtxR family transcriptional regulator